MKTKAQIYQELFDEIISERKGKKKFSQVMIMIVLEIILMVLISFMIESDTIVSVLIIVVIATLFILSGELPLGKVQEPTEAEVIQYAKEKIDALMTENSETQNKITLIKTLFKDWSMKTFILCVLADFLDTIIDVFYRPKRD